MTCLQETVPAIWDCKISLFQPRSCCSELATSVCWFPEMQVHVCKVHDKSNIISITDFLQVTPTLHNSKC